MQNVNQNNNTDASAIAAFMATKGATIVPTATAQGGTTPQRQTPAPQSPARAATVAKGKGKPAAATKPATQGTQAAAKLQQAVTQATANLSGIVPTGLKAVLAANRPSSLTQGVPVPAINLPKAHQAKAHVAKPTAKGLAKATWLSPTTPPKGMRPGFWANYTKGVTPLYCTMSNGLDALQLQFYVDNGYVKLTPAKDADVKAAVAAWEKGKLYAHLQQSVVDANKPKADAPVSLAKDPT